MLLGTSSDVVQKKKTPINQSSTVYLYTWVFQSRPTPELNFQCRRQPLRVDVDCIPNNLGRAVENHACRHIHFRHIVWVFLIFLVLGVVVQRRRLSFLHHQANLL